MLSHVSMSATKVTALWTFKFAQRFLPGTSMRISARIRIYKIMACKNWTIGAYPLFGLCPPHCEKVALNEARKALDLITGSIILPQLSLACDPLHVVEFRRFMNPRNMTSPDTLLGALASGEAEQKKLAVQRFVKISGRVNITNSAFVMSEDRLPLHRLSVCRAWLHHVAVLWQSIA